MKNPPPPPPPAPPHYNFHVVTQFNFSYSLCSCTIFILTSLFVDTGYANLILIDVQYLQNVVFGFEKVQMRKITPRQIPTSLPLYKRLPPTRSCYSDNKLTSSFQTPKI